ncbi:MAG: hypothetical protein DRI71_10375, partial [Bacteroidetes bacterium]
MPRALYIFFLLLVSTISYSQKLVIRDGSTLRVIPDVLVFNNTHSEISDLNGEISLKKFPVGDSL